MKKPALAALVAFALLASACSTSSAAPETEPSGRPEPTTSIEPSIAAPVGVVEANSGPVETVTADGVVDHLEALQAIADEHDGTRVSGSPGYDASVRYVADVLRATGYEVGLVSTEVPVFELEAPTVFERTSPDAKRWVDGVDFRSMLFSPSGDVRGRVTFAGTGCATSDFAGFPAGDVALVVPGDCFRRQQVRLAQGAEAAAMIGVGRTGTGFPLSPTLVYPEGITIPAISVTSDLGAELEEGSVVHVRVRASTHYEDVESVIADLPSGRGDVVMLGGHLDSALDGPGLNDNGSGTALLLETARWLADAQPDAAVRFAFWAGEEEGLWGSWDYAHRLPSQEREAIEVYINMDMIASPNFVTFVYEADDDPVSRLVEDLFVEALDEAGLESELLNLHGASDHAAFADVGVPTGGLYSGSQEIKTDEQAQRFGGTAGDPLDECYHQPCDTLDHLRRSAIRIHAAAFVDVVTALLLT